MSKAASTWFALVLAAGAMLVVFGCGGDSATETASAPGSSTAPASATEGREDSSSKQGSPGSKSSRKEGSASEQAAGTTPATGKQGPTITPPKGPQENAPTSQERAEATVISMSLQSPALKPGPESVSLLPATYTCDGKDTWPELKWGGVPPGTAELALTVLSLEPVGEALFFNWAVAGLDPALTELKSGALPGGAVLGKNSYGKAGYSICPPKGQETYIFTLYALPESLAARKGFDPAALRKQILAMSGEAGILATSYARG